MAKDMQDNFRVTLLRQDSYSDDEQTSASDPFEERRPVLFGDHFGTKAEYTRGIFYGGRWRYLHNESLHALQAPEEFMTRRQKRDAIRLRKQGIQQMQKLDFAKKNEGDEIFGTKAAQARKLEGQGKKSRKEKIIIQKFSSTNKNDWSYESQAGCKFWINHFTGEVSTECPWNPTESIADDENNETVYGTGAGSLEFNSSEVGDFLAMLDEMDSKSEKRSAKK